MRKAAGACNVVLCDEQDENEEMGRDLAEGHVHALERQLALAKSALEDMRRAYLQLEDITQQLDSEVEDLQAQVPFIFALESLREACAWRDNHPRIPPLQSTL